MARMRENVSPKITSHSAGWMARVYSSARSWRIFATSTQQKVMTLLSRIWPGNRRPETSAHAAGGAAERTDIPQSSSFFLERPARVVAEDVLERRVRTAFGRLEVSRRSDDPHPALVHQRHAVTELVGLLHVVGREQDRRARL